MPKLLIWGIVIVVLAASLDQLLLWMEARGWVYYRRTKGRGGGALYHTLELHSVFDPSIEQIQKIKVKEERRQDESGDPPVPDEDPPDRYDSDDPHGVTSRSSHESGRIGSALE
jgi:hypothetical protein